MTTDEINQLALAIGKNVFICQKEILTLEEVAQYTGLTKSQLYKLTSKKIIPHYKPTGKICYFKRSEVDAWLTSNPVATESELNDRAQSYCLKNKR